jgi:DNA-binding phage protein
MALTRDFKRTIVESVQRDPEFARALLDEAATLFLNGEADAARLVLRDLVNATVGFEGLAAEMGKPAKSLHRMLSKNGNPTMDNLAAILGVVRRKLGVELQARTEFDLSRNKRVAELLSEHDGRLDQARPVQHWAYFPTDESRAQFSAFIAQRFSNIDAHVSPVSRGKEYAVTFWHTGTPDAESMTEITSALSLAADSCGGEYDGWETQILP